MQVFVISAIHYYYSYMLCIHHTHVVEFNYLGTMDVSRDIKICHIYEHLYPL